MHTTCTKSRNPQAQEKMLLKKGFNIHGKPIKKSKLNKVRKNQKNGNDRTSGSGAKRGPKKGTKRNLKGKEKENLNNAKKRKRTVKTAANFDGLSPTKEAMKKLNPNYMDENSLTGPSTSLVDAVVNPYDAGF